MAFPTFTSGDVLLASDMNAVGLWLVKTQTIGSAVSSVEVTSAFSSSYDAYLITVNGGVGSANGFLKMTLGASTTGYYQARQGIVYSTGARSDGADNNAAAWTAVGSSTTDNLSLYMTINNPFLAKYTQVNSYYLTATAATMATGEHRVATSYTSFTLAPNSGTLTGGTIRVYGYRN
jgi:hypothetical protein